MTNIALLPTAIKKELIGVNLEGAKEVPLATMTLQSAALIEPLVAEVLSILAHSNGSRVIIGHTLIDTSCFSAFYSAHVAAAAADRIEKLKEWKRYWSGEMDTVLAGRADETERADRAEAEVAIYRKACSETSQMHIQLSKELIAEREKSKALEEALGQVLIEYDEVDLFLPEPTSMIAAVKEARATLAAYKEDGK